MDVKGNKSLSSKKGSVNAAETKKENRENKKSSHKKKETLTMRGPERGGGGDSNHAWTRGPGSKPIPFASIGKIENGFR